MATLQELIDGRPDTLVFLTKGGQDYQFNCAKGDDIIMYDGSVHPKTDTGWEYSQANSFMHEDEALDKAKRQAKGDVDTAVAMFRLKYITSIPGQDATYARKEKAAQEWTAEATPDINDPKYRYLKAENSARGRAGVSETPDETAGFLLAVAGGWDAINAAAEEERIAGKMAIDNATTEGGVLSALNDALSAIEAL